MSEMKLIMENFRRFSEQMCTGGQCNNSVPSQSREEMEQYLKQLIAAVKASGRPDSPAYKKAMAGFGPEIKRIKQKLANLPEAQVKEQAGETGPDPLGLRNFGNIASIDGYRGFEGESMKNGKKEYLYKFDNLGAAQKGQSFIETALKRTTAGQNLAKKNISLISAKVLQPENSSFSMNPASLARVLKVVWSVGNQIPQNKAKEAEDTLVTPAEVMP